MVVLAASDLRLDTNWVDYLLIGVYFAFVLGIGVMAKTVGLEQPGLLPVGTLAPGVGDRAGLHLGQPRRRRDHRHERQRRQLRHPHRALLLGRCGSSDAVPRRRDDAVLLRLQGPFGARVHAQTVRHRRPPRQRLELRPGPAADRRHQPVPAGEHRRGHPRLEALDLPDRGRGDRAHLHHARRPVGGDLQRGAPVLRDRRGAAATDDHRPEQGRRMERPPGQGGRQRRWGGAALVVAGHGADRVSTARSGP